MRIDDVSGDEVVAILRTSAHKGSLYTFEALVLIKRIVCKLLFVYAQS